MLFQLTNFRFFLFFKNFDSPHIHSSSVLQIAVPTRKGDKNNLGTFFKKGF